MLERKQVIFSFNNPASCLFSRLKVHFNVNINVFSPYQLLQQCDSPATAKCFAFRCNIRHLGARRTAAILIKSRLWNATLVEDYPRVSYVSIKSKGSLILPEDMREDQSQDDDVDSAETLAYPDLLDQLPPEEVPLWVILVSIFAGLLLLILIVLLLWKLGFFERKRPDPTLSGNLDKDANGY